jgi:hypothetical protein
VTTPVEIRAADGVEAGRLREHVATVWHARSVAVHDELLFPAELPGFVAVTDGRIVGHVSYRIAGDRCAARSRRSTLSLPASARARGCSRRR